MGCDYYIWTETVIQYKDSNGNLHSHIEGTEREQGYISYNGDPDFDEPHNLNYQIKKYGKRSMFENGTWYCLDIGKNRIKDICSIKNIPFNSILFVFKFKNGYVS